MIRAMGFFISVPLGFFVMLWAMDRYAKSNRLARQQRKQLVREHAAFGHLVEDVEILARNAIELGTPGHLSLLPSMILSRITETKTMIRNDRRGRFTS